MSAPRCLLGFLGLMGARGVGATKSASVGGAAARPGRLSQVASPTYAALWFGALCALAAALALALLLATVEPAAPEGASEAPASAAVHVWDVCGPPPAVAVAPYDLPEVTATNWGQADASYAYPPERLAVCADGRGFLWAGVAAVAGPRQMEMEEVEGLFSTVLAAWPQGGDARGDEDGNFLWVLDADYNLVVAPVMQERDPGSGLVEVKHGDLCPGVDFSGHNGAAGPYRGVARMGGEFDLAGARNGTEWVMHTKSAYTASRVPPEEARQFHRNYSRAGKSDLEIARNFQACVMQDVCLCRAPLARVFCYLRRQMRVRAVGGDARTCDILNKFVLVPGHGNLPNLTECLHSQPQPGWAPTCADGDAVEAVPPGVERPLVHLVDWRFPGQTDPCDKTVVEFTASFFEIGARMGRLSEAAPDEPRRLQKKTKFLRKHSCFTTAAFTEQLRCNIHGCFGEGFTQALKAVEDALEAGPSAAVAAQAAWSHAMRIWERCVGGALEV